MSSGTVFGTLGDPQGPRKTGVFLKEFNDFHYCGNPGFSLVSVAHPRRPGRPPGTDSTPQPHSAPRAVCTFYIVLFTILFTTLRFPKSTATPDLRGRRTRSFHSRGLRPLPPTPKTNSQHSEPYATANGMRAIHCVVNGLLLKFGLKRSASCVCSS